MLRREASERRLSKVSKVIATGSIGQYAIFTQIVGSRHTTTGETPLNERVQKIVDVELETVNESLKEPICYSEVDLDLRSVRFKEVYLPQDAHVKATKLI